MERLDVWISTVSLFFLVFLFPRQHLFVSSLKSDCLLLYVPLRAMMLVDISTAIRQLGQVSTGSPITVPALCLGLAAKRSFPKTWFLLIWQPSNQCTMFMRDFPTL